MRFNCGHEYRVKARALERWHRWYAWFPVRVGPQDCRWLEHVERKGTLHHCHLDYWWTWEYRKIV